MNFCNHWILHARNLKLQHTSQKSKTLSLQHAISRAIPRFADNRSLISDCIPRHFQCSLHGYSKSTSGSPSAHPLKSTEVLACSPAFSTNQPKSLAGMLCVQNEGQQFISDLFQLELGISWNCQTSLLSFCLPVFNHRYNFNLLHLLWTIN